MRASTRVLGLCAAALWFAWDASAFSSAPSRGMLLSPAGERASRVWMTMEAGGRREFSGRRREAVGAVVLSALAGISLLPEAAAARGGRVAIRGIVHPRSGGAPHPLHPIPGSSAPYVGNHALGAVRGRGAGPATGPGETSAAAGAARDAKGAQDAGSERARKDTCPIKGACAPKEQYAPPPL